MRWLFGLLFPVLALGSVLVGGCSDTTGDAGNPPDSRVPPGGNPRDRDETGWSVFNPSDDTRQIHVSSVSGNDTTGDGSIDAPYATIARGLSEARNGFPDWVLLKRGETWEESDFNFNNFSGRSRDEPFLLGTYGDYSDPRPLVQTGTGGAFTGGNNTTNLAIVGIEWRANLRDPSDPGYTGPSSSTPSGFNFFVPSGQTLSGILLEDNLFAYFQGNDFNGGDDSSNLTDIVLRRNAFLDNYATSPYSHGVYCGRAGLQSNDGIHFEENIFDHNGWLIQSTTGGSSFADGQATDNNHSIYCPKIQDSDFVGNISIRPSAFHIKHTAFIDANYPNGSNENNVVENNLFVDSEIGIQFVGQYSSDSNVKSHGGGIYDNVFIDGNRSQQTQRNLAWAISLGYQDGATVQGNLILNAASSATGARALYIRYYFNTNPTIIENNIVFNWSSTTGTDAIWWEEGGLAAPGSIIFRNNIIESPGYLVDASGDLSDLTFSGNSWTSTRAAGSWFELPPAAGGNSLADWNNWTGDTGTTGPVDFVDDSRTIETYMASIGETPTYARFIELQRAQRRGAWRRDMEAGVINDYFREGFTPR